MDQLFISMVTDIIVSSATIGTAFFAFLSLRTWRKEMKARPQFELARRILKDVYSFQDAMRAARSPLSSSYEFPQDYDPFSKDLKKKESAYIFMYNNRLKPIIEIRIQLYTDAIEATVLWGKEIKEQIHKLVKKVIELQYAFQIDIQNITKSQTTTSDSGDRSLKNQKIIYSQSISDKLDSFDQSIQDVVKIIEELLFPILNIRRKKFFIKKMRKTRDGRK